MHTSPEKTNTVAERQRYARQMILPEIGTAGQERLARSGVIVVGAGGLGSPVIMYLAAAGVGRIGIVDDDTVSLSNLHRQIIHTTSTLGQRKTESAAAMVRALNPHIRAETYPTRLHAANAREILGGYDVVVDASDNFAAKYLLNDACLLLDKPLVHAGIYRFEGQVSVFHPPQSPCYRCLHPHVPSADAVPGCAESGVLGILPGLVGSMQATETLKLLLGIGQALTGRLLLVDTKSMAFRELRIQRNPDCAYCRPDAPEFTLEDLDNSCRDDDAAALHSILDIDAAGLQALLEREPQPLLLDVREPHEFAAGHLPGALSLPLSQLPHSLPPPPGERPVVTYCLSGRRSRDAAALLSAHGFDGVFTLEGGIRAWEELQGGKES